MKIEFKWEPIGQSDTWRAKVFGGWVLLRSDTDGDCMIFIPDPNHEWQIE